jgi:DNA mismatch endonuclease (patch repair protein)
MSSMADILTREERSARMRLVRSRDTKPERAVRSLLHRFKYRFRLHRKDLPGAPDIVLPRHGKIILVHGCFWHCHQGCRRATRPVNNAAWWTERLDGNMRRDRRNRRRLRQLGWKVLVVWECEIGREERVLRKLLRFLEDS